MKRVAALIFSLLFAFTLLGCESRQTAGTVIDYGSSSLYATADMDAAIAVIKKEFSSWQGCELHTLTFAGDEVCADAANLAWMNELERANDAREVFTECIVFESSFHSPKEGTGAWNSDEEYTGWTWWLARSDGGRWKLMTWGY